MRSLILVLSLAVSSGHVGIKRAPFDPDTATGGRHAFADGFDADAAPTAISVIHHSSSAGPAPKPASASIDGRLSRIMDALTLLDESSHERALEQWRLLASKKGKLQDALKRRLQIEGEKKKIADKYASVLKHPLGKDAEEKALRAERGEAASPSTVTAQSTGQSEYDGLDSEALKSSLEKVAAGLEKIDKAIRARKQAAKLAVGQASGSMPAESNANAVPTTSSPASQAATADSSPAATNARVGRRS